MKPNSSIVHFIPPDEDEESDASSRDRPPQTSNSQSINDAFSLSSLTRSNSRSTAVSQPPRALNGLIQLIESAIQDIQNIRTSERMTVNRGPVRENNNNTNRFPLNFQRRIRSEEQASSSLLEQSTFLNSFVKFLPRSGTQGQRHPHSELPCPTQDDSSRPYSSSSCCPIRKSFEYKRKVSDACQTVTQSANEYNFERENSALDDDRSSSTTTDHLQIDMNTCIDATQQSMTSRNDSVTEASIAMSLPNDLTIVSTRSTSNDQDNSNLNNKNDGLQAVQVSNGTTDTTDKQGIEVHSKQNDTK